MPACYDAHRSGIKKSAANALIEKRGVRAAPAYIKRGRTAMRLRVLGCSGGIGGQQNRTTSFLADDDILIDAGTGVGDLSLSALTLIDHIFITHSHLDHVNSIAFFVDSVGALRPKPVTVYALAATISILKKNLFNWDVWPDFSQ